MGLPARDYHVGRRLDWYQCRAEHPSRCHRADGACQWHGFEPSPFSAARPPTRHPPVPLFPSCAQERADKQTKKKLKKKWSVGLFIFISFSIINFAALSFAPSSVLTPIESIQFVTNIVYNRFINKAVISRGMIVGVVLALLGTVLSIVFGAGSQACRGPRQLETLWADLPWLVYLIGTCGIAVATGFAYLRYRRAKKAGRSLWAHAIMSPFLFTVTAALLGGAQMIVHSKAFSTMLSMAFQGNLEVFTESWILYVEMGLTVVCGIIWVLAQMFGVALYDPLVILPLLVGTYIMFGGVAGGLFFQEFNELHVGRLGYANWALYVVGMLLVVVGLAMIAIAGTKQSQKYATGPGADDALSPGARRWRSSVASVVVLNRVARLIEFSPHTDPSYSAATMPASNTVLMSVGWNRFRERRHAHKIRAVVGISQGSVETPYQVKSPRSAGSKGSKPSKTKTVTPEDPPTKVVDLHDSPTPDGRRDRTPAAFP